MVIVARFKRLLSHIKRVSAINPFYPNVHSTAHLSEDAIVSNPNYIYMDEDANIARGATIMNDDRGRFYMKKWSFASVDLLVICGNHMPVIGMPMIKVTDEHKREFDKESKYDRDVIIEEDVWIGARVTILPGVIIGRGSIVAAGSVVTHCVSPYSVWGGGAS